MEEYFLSKDENALKEIMSVADEIFTVAHENSLIPVLVEICLLYAQFCEMKTDFNGRKKYMDMAQKFLSNVSLPYLNSLYDQEVTRFENSLKLMKSAVKQNMDSIEKLEKNDVLEYLRLISDVI